MKQQNKNKIGAMLNLIQHLPLPNKIKEQTLLITTGKRETPDQVRGGLYIIKTKAFTLIELLVVVLIIGILAAIALPQYQKAVWKSRFSTVKALVRSITDAEEVYYMANNTYTNEIENLDISLPPFKQSTVSDVSKRYAFDWGHCALNNGTLYDGVNCVIYQNGEPMIGYNRKYVHAPAMVGAYCIAYTLNENALATKICQQDTGKNTLPSNGEQTYRMWQY